MFTKENTNRIARDFKYALNESIAYADETQESVALKIGVTQAQMSNWTNPTLERNFPMAFFPLLPARMQQYLIKHLNAQSQNQKAFSNLNGSIDDELVTMITLEAELKKKSEIDPAGAMKVIGKMREVLDRAEAEISNAKAK